MKTKLVDLSVIRLPGVWIPLAMSLAALALVLGHAAVFGVVHEAAEGTAAHVWQIPMAGQLPILAYFIVKWLPSRPGASLKVLGLLSVIWLTWPVRERIMIDLISTQPVRLSKPPYHGRLFSLSGSGSFYWVRLRPAGGLRAWARRSERRRNSTRRWVRSPA